MANISGTNVAAAIAPFTTEDKFPTHYSKYGAGGWHEVETEAERDLIPEERRVAGMAVYVVENGKLYFLQKDGSWLENKVDLSGYLTKAEALEKYLEKSEYNSDKELMFGNIDYSGYKEKGYVLQLLVNLEQSFIDDLGNPENVNGEPFSEANGYKLGENYLCFAGFDESLVFHYDLWDDAHSGILSPAISEAIDASEKAADKKYATKEELNTELSKKLDKADFDGFKEDAVVYTKYEYQGEQKKGILLDNNVNILGKTTDGDSASLVTLSKWNKADFGSAKVSFNVNTKDFVTVNDKNALISNDILKNFVKQGDNIQIVEVEENYPGTEIPTKAIKISSDLSAYSKKEDLATVATSGSYVDLSNKPQINNVEIAGNKTLKELGIQPEGEYLVAKDIENKADKATTLAGYGIEDAYTKSEVDAKVSSVYRFKGSVENYDALPKESNVVGDVYNVEDTGANYAWNGNEWDKLSETIDLSPYALKSEIPTKVSQLANDSNYVNTTTLADELAKKQNNLTFDEVPTQSSNNPVKSGGIFDELAKKANKEELKQVALSGSYNDTIDKPQINNIELSGNKTLEDLGIQAKGEYLTASDIENKADKADTLAGYGITDAYTKEEVDAKIPTEYKLPIASDSVLGGIKVGSGLSITEDGILSSTGTGGTMDYDGLNNKPQINSIELSGNKSLEELGIQPKGDYLTEAPVTSVNGETGAVVVKAIQDDNTKASMLKLWYGSREEYDLIAEKDEHTVYLIKKEGSEIDIYDLIAGKQDALTAGNGIEIVQEIVEGETINKINNTKPNVQADWNAVEGAAQILNKPSNLTAQGNEFNGPSQLVQLTEDGKLPAIDGSELTGIITEIPAEVTTQGNEFNIANKLVKLDAQGRLPAIDGSQLLGVATEVPVATVSKAGIVKPDGTTITVTADGTISSKGGAADIAIATTGKAGIVKSSGTNLKVSVDSEGVMSVNGLATELASKLTPDKIVGGANVTVNKNVETGIITISSIGGGGSVDMTNYYTKAQADANFGSKSAEHVHSNKTTILDLFALDGDVLKWDGKVIPLNPGQVEKTASGAQTGQVFDVSSICTEENIKALINGYLFVHNSLSATPDLEEGTEDPNTAIVTIYNNTILMDTIKIAPNESRTYELPNLKGIKISINGTIESTISLVGYIY